MGVELSMNSDDLYAAADRLQIVVEAYHLHGLTESGRADLETVLDATYRYADLLD